MNDTLAHEKRLHSLCSASGAERWLNCPGSVGLSRDIPPQPSGPHALEGTRAHELSETILKHWEANQRRLDPTFVERLRPKYRDTVDVNPAFGSDKPWDMVDYAMTYVNACIDEVDSFDEECPVSVRLEHRLTFNADMAMFGTVDFFATGLKDGKGYGTICDLKYGKKKVKTDGNEQLAFYAVALAKASKRKLERVKVRIVQPRIGHWLSEVEYSLEELKEWNKKLTLGAEKALVQIGAEKPELKTGGWCWFCPANEVCPEKIKQQGDCFDDEITFDVE